MNPLILIIALFSAIPGDEAFFEANVRPVLARHCIKCHGPEKQSGGLRLDSAAALAKGAKAGPVIDTATPAESPLLLAIKRNDDAPAMPPDKALPARELADLAAWIQAGAPWPKAAAPVQSVKHWAFEPVKPVSADLASAKATQNFIDGQLAQMQSATGVKPDALADKRVLARRLYFSLTGLPPAVEELEAFMADTSPNAYEMLVEKLLKSPQYGEKLGRMWMDVAHYADSAGETADFPAPEAWRYRDYIIESFNKDKPFNEFLREQVAGDILARQLPKESTSERYRELITATGYLSISRRFGYDINADHHLTIEDTIDTLGKSALGLTLGCARCHDHKYDPVSAEDYYSLYGIFASSRYPFPGCEKDRVPKDHTPLLTESEIAAKRLPLQAEIDKTQEKLSTIENSLRKTAETGVKKVGQGEIANGGSQEFQFAGEKAVSLAKGEQLRLAILPKNGHGADSTLVELILEETVGEKRTWDLTKTMLADPEQGGKGFSHADTFGNSNVWNLFETIPAPRLLSVFVKDAEKTPGLLVWRGGSDVPSFFININDKPISFITVKQPARSVGLHPGPSGTVVVAFESPISGRFNIRGKVADIDTTGGDGIGWELSTGPGIAYGMIQNVAAVAALDQAKKRLEEFNQSIPVAYAMAEGKPQDAKIQIKGDPATLGPEAPRRNLKLFGGQPIKDKTASGRLDLAGWITANSNPLTARVIVNRIWQLHFGQGLVRSPDNFGVRGEPPVNQALLDGLTARFIAGGWSIKWLNHVIVSTDAFKRADVDDDENLKRDYDNTSLWKYNRRRLTAEEIRDSLLSATGSLDLTPAGPHPFPPAAQWRFTQHTPFIDVYDHNRRGVYLMTQRIRRHPFLALFDGPDTNACTGRRDSTTVPTQALFFLNDPFVHQLSLKLARELQSLPDDGSRLNLAAKRLYARPARADELQIATDFIRNYAASLPPATDAERRAQAWAAWLRVMFSSNEFIYLE